MIGFLSSLMHGIFSLAYFIYLFVINSYKFDFCRLRSYSCNSILLIIWEIICSFLHWLILPSFCITDRLFQILFWGHGSYLDFFVSPIGSSKFDFGGMDRNWTFLFYGLTFFFNLANSTLSFFFLGGYKLNWFHWLKFFLKTQ